MPDIMMLLASGFRCTFLRLRIELHLQPGVRQTGPGIRLLKRKGEQDMLKRAVHGKVWLGDSESECGWTFGFPRTFHYSPRSSLQDALSPCPN